MFHTLQKRKLKGYFTGYQNC